MLHLKASELGLMDNDVNGINEWGRMRSEV